MPSAGLDWRHDIYQGRSWAPRAKPKVQLRPRNHAWGPPADGLMWCNCLSDLQSAHAQYIQRKHLHVPTHQRNCWKLLNTGGRVSQVCINSYHACRESWKGVPSVPLASYSVATAWKRNVHTCIHTHLLLLTALHLTWNINFPCTT